MTIRVFTPETGFVQDMADVLRLFYGGAPIFFNEEGEADLRVEHAVSRQNGRWCDQFTGGPVSVFHLQGADGAGELEQKRLRKRAVKLALYEYCKKRTGVRSPWGSLTGIRPSRLYYEALEEGLDPVRDARKVRREIGLVPQETSLYPELSALENLRFHAALYLDDQRMAERRIDEVFELVDLADRAKDAVGSYSGGMKRRLALGRAMLADPRILLLDEPTLGVDVQGTHRIWDYVRRFKGEGRTVLVSTNVMAEADALADEILLLDHGRKVRFGTPEELKAEAGSTVVRITSVSGSRVDEAALRGRLDGFSFDGESIVVDAPGGEADLARILGLVEGAVEIAGVELHRPTLDDAFLALTGRSLRD